MPPSFYLDKMQIKIKHSIFSIVNCQPGRLCFVSNFYLYRDNLAFSAWSITGDWEDREWVFLELTET